jgi:hypothetical protein
LFSESQAETCRGARGPPHFLPERPQWSQWSQHRQPPQQPQRPQQTQRAQRTQRAQLAVFAIAKEEVQRQIFESSTETWCKMGEISIIYISCCLFVSKPFGKFLKLGRNPVLL